MVEVFDPAAVSYLKVKSHSYLRLAIYRQLVRLGVKHLETHDQRFFPTQSQSQRQSQSYVTTDGLVGQSVLE
jgi:hypothetical protein